MADSLPPATPKLPHGHHATARPHLRARHLTLKGNGAYGSLKGANGAAFGDPNGAGPAFSAPGGGGGPDAGGAPPGSDAPPPAGLPGGE